MLQKTREFVRSLTPKQMFDVFFISLSMFVGIYLRWRAPEVVIFGIFIWIILNPVSSRYLAAGAIFFLILTPIFLVTGNNITADQLAIYAYYFLIMAVIMGIVELWREKKKN